MSPWGWGFWGSPDLCDPYDGCWAAQFLWFSGYWYSRLSQSFGEKDGNRISYSSVNPVVLIEIELFSLSKHLRDCCRPLVNFQNSGKLDFDNFCQCFYSLYGRMNLWKSLFCNSFWKCFSGGFILKQGFCCCCSCLRCLPAATWTCFLVLFKEVGGEERERDGSASLPTNLSKPI